jgi:hypothetical protein
MKWENWALDAQAHDRDGTFVWCPIDENGDIVTGMNYVSNLPPNGEKLFVFHLEGEEACDRWCEAHKDLLDDLKDMLLSRNRGKVELE